MTGSDGGKPAVAGGLARHTPVLGPAALDFLNLKDGGVYIDGTFGAGGYTRLMLDAADCRVIGIDRDQSAIAQGADLVASAKGRLELVQSRFSTLDDVARQCGHRVGRWRRARSRRLVDAARSGRARIFLPQ